jgi:hypothetical protein
MKITRGFVEQVTVECPMKDKSKALNWVYDNGYKTIYTGPKPTPRGPTSLSQKTYQIVAAKDVDLNSIVHTNGR